MMNKRSLKLTAWLLTLVMVFNMLPASALGAVVSNQLPEIPMGNAAEITVTYIGIDGGQFPENNYANQAQRSGSAPTPSMDKYNEPWGTELAGWSLNRNYNGTGGTLFAPGSYVDFNIAQPDGNKQVTLYAVKKKTVTFQANGTYSGPQQVFVIPGETAAKPSQIPVAYDQYNYGAFDKWLKDGQAYDFSTPVTSDITLTAYYLPVDHSGDNQGGNQGGNNQGGNQGGGNVSADSTDFVIQYLIPGSYNYVNPGQDIEFDRRTVTGVPAEYYKDNNKTRIDSSKMGVYTHDTEPQSKVWDKEAKILKLYYSPIKLYITLHYRRILTETTAENLDQTNGGQQHGYSGDVNPTYNSYNGITLITALPGFLIPNDWIDVDPEFTFAGFKYGQDNNPSGRTELHTIEADWINHGNGSNLDITLFYNGKTEEDEHYSQTVILTAASASKVYDGQALTDSKVTATGLPEGFTVQAVVSGSRTDAGESANVITSYVILDASGKDVTEKFTNVTTINGKLTVTKAPVVITTGSASKVYDGTALTNAEAGITGLMNGETAAVTATGTITAVGSTGNTYSIDWGSTNKDNYIVTERLGTLEVTKRTVTITAASDTKVYDGTALTNDGYTNTALAAGDKIDSVTVTGSQTAAGKSDNVPSEAKIVNADGTDVTASYAVTYADGTLEVTPKAVTITADSDTKIYDGTPLTKNSYTSSGLAAGDSFGNVTVTGSRTAVGTNDNVPSDAKIVNAAGEDVTASYAITYMNGTLEVTPKAVTITADSDNKIYDGTPLTKNSYTNTDLAAGDTVDSVTVTGSQTAAGKSGNVPSAAKIVNAAGEDVTASYAIAYANGELKVTPKAVTITAASDTKVYDGTALTKNSYTNTDLVEGDKIDSVTVTGSQTAAGKSDNVPSEAKIVNADGTDVTASYAVTYVDGTLEVTPKAVMVTADSDTKVYDGTALTKNSYINTDLAAGDSFGSVTVTGSQTVVGTSDNIPSAAKIVNAAGEDVTASYTITYVNGKLEVTPKAVTITADSDTKVYDGTPLTKNSYIYTALAAGDAFTNVTVTGSQTVVGTSDNVPSAAAIMNAAGEDVTASYDINYANGTLSVTINKALIITAGSGEKVYDGTALTMDAYTAAGLASGDRVESVVITGSQTVVGTSDNVPSAAKIVNTAGEDVTASYEITYVNGTLAVMPKSVTITADSDEKVYDGTALTNTGFTNTALAAGDSISSVTVTGSQTAAGRSGNVPGTARIVNSAGEDVTGSYTITYVSGELKVTPKNVMITADSGIKIYDGTALTKNSYINTVLALGDSIDSVTVTGSQTVVGKSNNVPSAAKIVNAAGEDVTASYTITYSNGSLEVTPKTVTITAASDTKAYDGTALTKDSFTNTELAAGDSVASVTVTGSQTVVGTSDNVPSEAKIVNAAGEDVTASYTISYVNGTLEVTPKAVTITADSDTKIYDGAALTNDGFTYTALAAGDSIGSVTVTGSRTVVGISDNVPSAAKIVNAAGEDVTASYAVTYADGTLEVNPKALTITADSDTKIYDGAALTNDGYTNTDLAAGDSIESAAITGSQTAAGSSSNVPSAAKIVNAAGEDVTSSYDITYANGTLEVTPKAVTITADSNEKIYDGTPLTKNSYNNTELAAGDTVDSVTVTGSQTAAGKSGNVPSAAKIVNAAGEDVTNSYGIIYVNGTLEVTPKAVTITADSDEKIYDGTPLTKNSYNNTELAAGDTVDSVTVTGSQTAAGKSGNVPSAAKIVNAAGEDVTASYAIAYANGELKVTPKAVTITADSDTKVYDGTPLTKNSYTSSGLAAGDSFGSVTVTGSQTVVGTSDNVPSAAVIKNAAGEDVTASYGITYVNGTLSVTVNPALIITAGSGTKVYDGTALTLDAYTVAGLAAGDRVESVVITGSQTVVGSSGNVPSAAVIKNAAGEDVTASYTIAYANGTLVVTPKAVTITADGDTKVYDGTALTKNSYTNTELAAGDSISSVTVTGSQTTAGRSGNVPSEAKIVNAAGEDVTASYEITYANGTLEVTKKTVTITADSDTKVYDGNALTKNSYTNTELATGDKIDSVTVTGSQTVVGKSDNVPSVAVIKNAAGEDVTASYEITYAYGTLEVTKKTVTITADSDTKVYDGTALTKNSYTNTDLAAGDSFGSVTVTGSQTVVGTSDNVPSAAVIKNAAGEDVTASYTITYVNGTLEVTPKAVTITADSDTKVYDGTPLTKNSYTNTALAAGDSIGSVTVTGSQIVVGTSENVPSAAVIKNAAGEDVTASYAITYAPGTLSVTINQALIITAGSDTKVYDGTALTLDTYTVAGLARGDRVESVVITGSQTVVGSSGNVPSAAKIVNATGTDVTASYEITYVNGTLEVTQKALMIIADSDEKIYDGTALTRNSYKNTDLAEGDLIAEVTVTGSQTVAGKSSNVPSAAKIVNAAGEDVTASYAISYANGGLKVTPKTVTITAASDTKVYDGTALTKNSAANTALASGDAVESVILTGGQIVVGTSDNVPSAAKIVNAAGDDVTASYRITYANGTLEVTPKAVTITADSDEKIYDGTALTKNSYTNTALAAGDSFGSVTVTGSQTVVGTSDNVPSAAVIVNAAGDDVTASYRITYANGTLEVTPKAVTITADSDEKIYDGTALTKNSYTNTALAAGDSIAGVTVTGSQTAAGRSSNIPSDAIIMNAAGDDVTASYAITYTNGLLEVTPKTVIITANSDAKVYDGTALTNDGFTYTVLAAGDSIGSVTVTGSRTVVGTSDNVPSAAKIVNGAGEDVTASYAVTYADGTLEVNPKAVTITADSDAKVYDGTALTKNSYTSSGLAAGDSIESAAITGSQTAAGSSSNVPSAAVIVNAAGEDVTSSYDITYANGTLEVTQKAVTITADSDTKVYDGTPLTKDSYTNTAMAEGDTVDSVTVTGSQTVVGTSNNVPSAAKIVNAAGEDVTASYAVTYVNGTLSVTVNPALIITASSGEKVYDGTALTMDAYTAAGLAEGDRVESVVITGSQAVVGSSDNIPSAAVIKNAAGEDVTNSYEIIYVNGTLEVTPKAVTITADSDEKIYDGTPLTKNSYNNTELAADDTVDSVTVTGSQTAAGKSSNVPSAAKIVNAAGEDVTASYAISYANGGLKVTPKAVTITADSDTKVYDGTALTKNSAANTALASGDAVESVILTGSQTVVGTSDNVPSAAKIVNGAGEDVTASYIITYAKGTLEVTPKAVTITADSDTKIYDGAAVTNDGYTNTDLAAGDSVASVTVTGSQTVVGTSSNVPSEAKIVNAAGEDVTASYTVTYVNGTLEVTPKAVTITADSDTKIYDGTALTNDGYTNTVLAAGDSVESVTVTGSRTAVGTSENIPAEAKIVNADGEDITASYGITYAAGTLEVTPKAVMITAASDTKVYDGTALTNDGYTNTALAVGDAVESVTVSGSQTAAGTSGNVPSTARIVNAAGEDVTANYAITYAAGTLEVTPKAVTITAEDKIKVYDNDPATDPALTAAVTGAVEGETIQFTLARTEGQNAGDYPITVTAGENPNYIVTVENGSFTITPIDVTVTIVGANSTVDYDGEAHTVTGYTVQTSSPLYTAADFTFNGTAEAVRTDAGTTVMGLVPEQFANMNPNFGTVTFVVTDGYQTINPVAVPTYSLLVRYWADGETASPDFRATYQEGAAYNVTSPGKAGYTVDLPVVSGIITEDTVIDVTYTRMDVTLTVRYMDLDGQELAEPKVTALKAGDSFREEAIELAGYEPAVQAIEGRMSGLNKEVTFSYMEITAAEDGRKVTTVTGRPTFVIDEYSTPLGIGETNRSAGETIE